MKALPQEEETIEKPWWGWERGQEQLRKPPFIFPQPLPESQLAVV